MIDAKLVNPTKIINTKANAIKNFKEDEIKISSLTNSHRRTISNISSTDCFDKQSETSNGKRMDLDGDTDNYFEYQTKGR